VAAPQTAQSGVGAGYTVLVVDDDPRIVELLHIALGAHGYRVISAGNGEEALKLAFHEQPDLVILDVRLPRRSGYEVCRAIRREPDLAHMPVIMVSALSDTEARLQGLERGADDYLTKPFSPKELLAKVKSSLEKAGKFKALERRSRELTGELERSREELRRALRELKREKELREAFDRLSTDLSRLSRPEEMASTFLFTLMTHLGAQVAAVLEPRGEESSKLVPTIVRGLEEDSTRALRLNADSELGNLLVALARPVRREELERFPEMRDELGPLVSLGIAVLVPVIARSQLAAVAVIGEKSEPAPYTNMDIEMATNLSRAAALAIDQAALLRHAHGAYEQAIRAYLTLVEARDPGSAWRAETVAYVCDALARELGTSEISSHKLWLLAVATILDSEARTGGDRPSRLGAFDSLRERSTLEREIFETAKAFVDLVGRLEIGAGARQIVAHLQGDRQVLQALEELLTRGELVPAKLLEPRSERSDTSAA
jgi:DNA-binding response OmpR family regulator